MTVARYTIGFILSLVLTMVAYLLVVGGVHSPWLLAGLAVLALTQMVVQLLFFLHVGEEAKPRYKQWSFILMTFMLFIVVAGSIWIMQNLNYNMMNMTPDQKNNYMMTQHDKGF